MGPKVIRGVMTTASAHAVSTQGQSGDAATTEVQKEAVASEQDKRVTKKVPPAPPKKS